ncbi:MAG: hypothetical protein LBH17_01580, partial [Oscillospiraceae bacterium]|nr:hypothetical protein [Oscillospiraceae bacterium]
MKKVLALVIAVLMVAAMTNIALAVDVPPEISDPAVAIPAGGGEEALWPLADGNHDPTLDDKGIPDGAYVYLILAGDAPASLTGYTKVDSAADLKPGTFTTMFINSYNYVIFL